MLYVTGETAPQAQDYARVPDVLGLDMRESAQALRLDGFEMNAQGDGLAARQSPIGRQLRAGGDAGAGDV